MAIVKGSDDIKSLSNSIRLDKYDIATILIYFVFPFLC